VRLDQGKQSLPRHDALHLRKEDLAPGLLALAQALGVTERQLHGCLLIPNK